MMRAAALISVAGLSACVGAQRPMALAESGPVAVELAGRSYIADLQPTEAGPVLAMTRDGAAFGNDEGAEAKRAAEAFCGSRGAAVNRAAYGHYAGGAWLFKGGCA